MGSTGEPDRKRRHLNLVPPAVFPMAKKLPSSFSSDDKKLDKAVLQYQNSKLLEKLQVQKVESQLLENSYLRIKAKQSTYHSVLKNVHKSLKNLVIDLGPASNSLEKSNWENLVHSSHLKDNEVPPSDDIFLNRLIEAGATETSSSDMCSSHEGVDVDASVRKSLANEVGVVLRHIVTTMNDVTRLEDTLHVSILKEIPLDDDGERNKLENIETEVKSVRLSFEEMHLKHKTVALTLQNCRDNFVRNKAEIERMKGNLEELVATLVDNHGEIAALKDEKELTKGSFLPILNSECKTALSDKVKDKSKDFDDLESCLRDLSEKVSSRLLEIKCLHDERIRMLELSSNLQYSLKNFMGFTSTQVYLNLRDRLERFKSEVSHYQTLLKNAQIEREEIILKEKEINMKNDVADIFKRCSTVAESRIADLGLEIQKQMEENISINAKLQEVLKIPGRKHMVAEFKTMVSTFPHEMESMQCQLTNFKSEAADINRLRVATQSLSRILDAKDKACSSLSARSLKQVSEIESLTYNLEETRNSYLELNLIHEMLLRESTHSSAVLHAKEEEYRAWANVHMLKSLIEDNSLELRVKIANEAEAISQHNLSSAEAEIANSGKKLEIFKSDFSSLSKTLQSKKEENDTYLSEIETIGQAYDDMQSQNQQLLQQITERDDCNINLVLERVKAKQARDVVLVQKKTLEKEFLQSRISLDFFKVKMARIEDHLKSFADLLRKLNTDRYQSSIALENTQKKINSLKKSLEQSRTSVEISHSNVDESRTTLLENQIELETERFGKRRIEEEVEVLNRRIAHIEARRDGSATIEKLQQELQEYKDIVKCSVCCERPKEVVITKCYHLFCNLCVQRTIDGRHRRCPSCSSSFGLNDVKPVYI